MIRHDVVEPVLLECDQVYHLACPASPVHYKFNPVKTIKTNVIGTMNMLGGDGYMLNVPLFSVYDSGVFTGLRHSQGLNSGVKV